MNGKFALFAVVLLISTAGCNMNSHAGPTQTSREEIDAGTAKSVRAEIHMGAGDLRLESGGGKLLTADFRCSESLGLPIVQYGVTDATGRLTVKSPKEGSSAGNTVNNWTLRIGSQLPLDATVDVGAGKANLDLSKLSLRSLEIHMGAGELQLNLAGKYTQDVPVKISSGVGEARIRLPKDIGAVVSAISGIGQVSANGLTQRDGKYYNSAYVEGKPAVRLDMSGGVGQVTLSVE